MVCSHTTVFASMYCSRSWVSDKSRGSRSLVPTEAGSPIQAGCPPGVNCDMIMFRKTTPDLQVQDQNYSVQDQDRDRFIWSQTGLVLRPTVSDHITGQMIKINSENCKDYSQQHNMS